MDQSVRRMWGDALLEEQQGVHLLVEKSRALVGHWRDRGVRSSGLVGCEEDGGFHS